MNVFKELRGLIRFWKAANFTTLSDK